MRRILLAAFLVVLPFEIGKANACGCSYGYSGYGYSSAGHYPGYYRPAFPRYYGYGPRYYGYAYVAPRLYRSYYAYGPSYYRGGFYGARWGWRGWRRW